MRTSVVFLLLAMAVFAGDGSATTQSAIPHGRVRLAFLCFLKGEQKSGLNKVCFYNCPTGDAAATIKAWELCPLSIQHD